MSAPRVNAVNGVHLRFPADLRLATKFVESAWTQYKHINQEKKLRYFGDN